MLNQHHANGELLVSRGGRGEPGEVRENPVARPSTSWAPCCFALDPLRVTTTRSRIILRAAPPRLRGLRARHVVAIDLPRSTEKGSMTQHHPGKPRVPLLAVALALSLLACTPRPAQPAMGDAPSALARWELRRPAAYSYRLTISCLCIQRGEYRIEIRDGEMTSLVEPTGMPVVDRRLECIPTVNELFGRMREAELQGTPVRAVYHAELGYPVEVEIGVLANDSGTLRSEERRVGKEW